MKDILTQEDFLQPTTQEQTVRILGKVSTYNSLADFLTRVFLTDIVLARAATNTSNSRSGGFDYSIGGRFREQTEAYARIMGNSEQPEVVLVISQAGPFSSPEEERIALFSTDSNPIRYMHASKLRIITGRIGEPHAQYDFGARRWSGAGVEHWILTNFLPNFISTLD